MDKKDMPRRREAMELRVRRTMAALEKNNMSAYFAQTSEEAVRLVEGLLCAGDTISCGGSVTLDADRRDGFNALRPDYEFLDSNSRENRPRSGEKLYRRGVFLRCVFDGHKRRLRSTESCYNVDGNGNRVAAMLFGPKKVLVFAGCNKIVRDIDDAAKRVKSCATPANAMRLNLDTPCTHGACPGTDGELCAGCRSENRICAMYTVLARQRVKGRIHVILIGEEVGY